MVLFLSSCLYFVLWWLHGLHISEISTQSPLQACYSTFIWASNIFGRVGFHSWWTFQLVWASLPTFLLSISLAALSFPGTSLSSQVCPWILLPAWLSELLPFRSRPCSSFDSYTDLPTPISLRIPVGLPCVCPASLLELHSPLALLFTTAHMFPLGLCLCASFEHCSPFSSASPAQPLAPSHFSDVDTAWSFPIISLGTHPQFLWNPWHLLVPLLGYKYPYSCFSRAPKIQHASIYRKSLKRRPKADLPSSLTYRLARGLLAQ